MLKLAKFTKLPICPTFIHLMAYRFIAKSFKLALLASLGLIFPGTNCFGDELEESGFTGNGNPQAVRDAFNSTATTGNFGYTSEKTWQDHGRSQVDQKNVNEATGRRIMDRYRPLGSGTGDDKDTLSTRTRGYLGSSGRPRKVTTQLITPFSVSGGPIGRRSFTLGFPPLAPEDYLGPYNMVGGRFGGDLPETSTAAVDITVAEK